MSKFSDDFPAFDETPASFSPLAKGTTIVGTHVVNDRNKILGRVEEVVIDDRIAYVILSFGGFFGLGKTLCAVPWKALHRDRERQVYVLNVSKAQIRCAPRLAETAAGQLASSRWDRNMRIMPNRAFATLQELLLLGKSTNPTTAVALAAPPY